MLRVMVLALLVALAGCHRQANAPSDAPTGLTVEEGDGRVTVRWDQLPGLTYWIFFQAGSSVGARDPGVPLIFDAHSPRVVAGLTNGVQYAFVMNATNQDSPGGPARPWSLGSQGWRCHLEIGCAGWNPSAESHGVVFGAALNRIVAVGDSGTLLAGDLNYTSTSPPG